MISWKEARKMAVAERPELRGKDHITIARSIFIQKNITEKWWISFFLSVIAMAVAMLALLE